MHGGLGIDTFVIKSGDGSTILADADVIYDFTDGTDIIGMNSLTFDQLTIAQGSGNYANHVLVKIRSTSEYVAVIQSMSVSNITALDFVSTSTADQTINGTTDNDTLIGGGGADTFNTSIGVDLVYGHGGNDTINVNGTGSKVIDGGSGTDSLVINYSGISNLGDFAISESGDYVVLTAANGDTIQFKNIENLTVGSIAYTATGTATGGYNVVNGYVNASERTLYLYPGSSATTASFGSAAQFEQVFGTKTSCITGDYTIVGSTADETLNLNVSNRTDSSTSECFTGGWVIDLKSGNDVINSAKLINGDSIDLGSGNDSISVMFGADAGGIQTIENADITELDGGAGIDTIRYDESTNGPSSISLTTAGATNFENIVGSPGAETITGDANANALAGGNYGGSSTVVDTLNGEAGNDLLIASYNTTGLCNDCFNTIPATINGSSNTNVLATSLNNYHTLTYSSSYYFSSSASHIFNGGAGNDTIFGGKGEETLNGGTGQDFMHGGLGIDTFVIKSGYGGSSISDADVVYDFTDGTDIIGMLDLNYSDLKIEQGTGSYSSHVVVKTIVSGEFLLIIQSISLSNIDYNDFSAI